MSKFLDFSMNIWNTNIYKNFLYFAFVLYFILIFYIIGKDNNSLKEKNNILYLVAVVVPLLIFAYLVISNVKESKYLGLFVIMSLVIVFFIFKSQLSFFDILLRNFAKSFTTVNEIPPLSKEQSYLVSITSKLLLLCIFLIFATLSFNLFFEESYRQKSRTSIILYALFFIPCLISDYFKYLLNELKTTPKVVYTLLIIEVILILLYIYIPKLFTKFIFKNSNRILSDPVFLNKKVVIANADVFYNNSKENKELEKKFNLKSLNDGDDVPNKTFLQNYGVSFWLTLNRPNLGETEECMIFRIGEDYGTDKEPDNPNYGYPYVSCVGSKIKIVFSNNIAMVGDETIEAELTIDIPYQKWNYFVFNYHDNMVDLFVNGELLETTSLQNYLPLHSHSQVVCVGSNTNKLHGAICEVRIHENNLGQTEIAQSYNLLKLKNPPVNNIY